jgi:chemotaxis protein CheY-P-specific phosphatase CheC
VSLSASEKELVVSLIQAGVQSSTERLGRMSGTEWGVNFAGTQEMSPVSVLSWFTHNQQTHRAVRFRSTTEMPLEMLLLFSEESARLVTEAVTKPYAAELGAVGNLVESTIGEVCNILAQNVLAVMSDRYQVSIILSVPEVSEGVKADLASAALEDYDGRKDVLLLAHVQLHSDRLNAECSMMVIVNEAVMRSLLSRPPSP